MRERALQGVVAAAENGWRAAQRDWAADMEDWSTVSFGGLGTQGVPFVEEQERAALWSAAFAERSDVSARGSGSGARVAGVSADWSAGRADFMEGDGNKMGVSTRV